jgi:hypothetical protein
MGRRRRQKTNNSIEDLVENEGNEYTVADPSRMVILCPVSSLRFIKRFSKRISERNSERLMEQPQEKLKKKILNKTTQIKNLRRHRNN